MKTMDHVKKRIITSMVAILLLIITIFGITYAYFISSVRGNIDEQSISVNAGKLQLEYGDGNGYIEALKIFPNTIVDSKTFTVKNTGGRTIESYEVVVQNVVNELTNYEDLTYTLTCKSYLTKDYEEKGNNAPETGTCNGNTDIFPKTEEYLIRNSIPVETTHAYVITLTYNESNKDQSEDMKKTISAKINIIDDEVNYKKVLVYGNSIQNGTPSPSTPVEIESVGDKKNLINPTAKTTTQSGVTFTVNDDGSITMDGTNTGTSNIAYYIRAWDFKYDANTTYTLSHNVSLPKGIYLQSTYKDGTGTTLYKTSPVTFATTVEDATASIYIRFDPGVTVDDLTIYPQLEKGVVATDYVSSEKYSIPITISNKNIADPNQINSYINDMQLSGVNGASTKYITDENNRKIVALFAGSGYGTENYEIIRRIFEGVFKKNTQYTISFDFYKTDTSRSLNLQILYTDGTYDTLVANSQTLVVNQKYNYYFTTDADKTVDSIRLNNNAGTTHIYMDTLQIEEGTKVTSFEPINTYDIILDEPLRKVGDCDNCADYIDLVNNTVVRNVNKYTFTGKEEWLQYSNVVGDNYTLDVKNAKYDGNQYVLSNEYIGNKSGGGTAYGNGNIWLQSVSTYPRLYIHDSNYTTSTLKTHLDNKYKNGNPLYVIYPLANTSQPEKLNINIPKIDKNSIIKVGTEVQPSKIETEY